MPIYEYKAYTAAGTPEYGSIEADNEEQLVDRLRAGHLSVESVRERTLDEQLRHAKLRLPRLLQLRIGEELRTAFLTDLPVPDALRALAAEPMQHPLRMLHLWLMLLTAAMLVTLVAVNAIGVNVRYAAYGTACALAIVVLSFPVLTWWFEQRIRGLLARLADAVERGQDAFTVLARSAPRDIAAVLNAQTTPERRARATADIVPFLGHRISSRHRLGMLVILPALLAFSAAAAAWALLYFIVPMFRSIFAGFDLEIPWYTRTFFWLSRAAEQLGIIGAVAILVITVVLLTTAYQLIIRGRAPDRLSWIPLVGSGLRQDQLARFGMTLSVLVRSGCEWSAAVRSATWGIGSKSICQQAETLARAIEQGGPLKERLRDLSALPITLLLPAAQASDVDPETVNSRVAEAFDAMAQVLSYSSLYQLHVLAALFHFFLLVFSAIAVFVGYFSLFGPLHELLNAF